MLFSIEPNVDFTDFEGVRPRRIVDIGRVPEKEGSVSDVRYFAGHF